MGKNNLLSIVVPVYNEADNIEAFYQALTRALNELTMDLEIIFVDDGCSDNSVALITDLSRRDGRVKCLRFSRNFGSHAALTAGLHAAAGDAAVIISADLQDPPEMIHAFVRRWREGCHVVWGVRESRQDPFFKKLFADLFYRLIRVIALPDYPEKGMDYGLLDRKVLDALDHFEEVHRILPTILVWTGFRQEQIPYRRRERHAGVSKWSFAKRFKAAVDIIVSFSYLPIRLISYFGLLVSGLSFVYAVFLIYRKLFLGFGMSGWPSIMVTVLFLGGVQLIVLGVLGEYIWRTSDQVKRRPLYIVMEKIGFDRTKDT